MKTIEVNISQCLSSTETIKVPDDFEYNSIELEKYVREQIILPSDCIAWYVDDLCVL